jgi:hypothetical protein
MIIADINVPLSVTMTWVYGALGASGVVGMILFTIVQARKVFGRKPPMDEQLSHLDKSLRKDMRAGDFALEEQIKSMRNEVKGKFDEISEARADHNSEIQRNFGAIAKKLDEQTAFLTVSAERRANETGDKILDLHKICARLDERTKKL